MKRELVAWLKLQVDPAEYLGVYRTPDNPFGMATRLRAVELPIAELLEEAR